jgi:hypothetical protein
MDQIIKNAENYDLSGEDIMRMCKNKVKIISYEEMENYKTIDDVFDNNDATIILYETKKNFGHWVLLLKEGNELEFFDSYGLKPDEELKYDNGYNAKIHNGVLVPHLTRLLNSSTYKLNYNKKRLQKLLKDMNTCGRWCVSRVLLRDQKLSKFQKLFTDNVNHNPDFWVTAYTLLL